VAHRPIYGADAVTGVVNYVLKKNFEGLSLNAQASIPTSKFSGAGYRIEGTWGKNFADGRGNVTLSGGYTRDNEVLLQPARFHARQWPCQQQHDICQPRRAASRRGDISAIGHAKLRIAAEQALVDRAANAPAFAIGADPRFAISSGAGLVFRNDFDFFSADVNNNGIPDCNESFIGRTGFGGGGCYVTTPGGGVRVFEDGIISTASNQFGGDGAVERTNETSLIPGSERIYANLRTSYEFSNAARVWVDAKYVRNNAISRNNYNTFYDSLLIFPDNPFIPTCCKPTRTRPAACASAATSSIWGRAFPPPSAKPTALSAGSRARSPRT
jgi:iron complex outermembrane recepter protein